MPTPHAQQCGYHMDQYDSECECGATRPATLSWAQAELAAAQHRLARASADIATAQARVNEMSGIEPPFRWPRNEKGQQYSAWPGEMKVGHVTHDGNIVHNEETAYATGTIMMTREQANIAAQHGWEVVEALGGQPVSFDCYVRRI